MRSKAAPLTDLRGERAVEQIGEGAVGSSAYSWFRICRSAGDTTLLCRVPKSRVYESHFQNRTPHRRLRPNRIGVAISCAG